MARLCCAFALAATAAAGCLSPSGRTVARDSVTWRPFMLAHVVDPAGGDVAAAAAALQGERYLDVITVSGAGAAEAVQALRAVGRPVFAVGTDGAAAEPDRPLRGLTLLPLTSAAVARATLAAEHGACVVGVAATPELPGDLSYVLESSPRLRLVLRPDAHGVVERRAGVGWLGTPALAAGAIRLVAVDGLTARTWLRRLGPEPLDEPATEIGMRDHR